MEYADYEALLAAARPWNSRNNSIDCGDTIDVEALLSETQKREKERITAELEQIDRQLQRRESIKEQTVDQLTDRLQEEQDRLHRMKRPFKPEKQLAEQKQRVKDIEQALQQTRRSYWQDTEQLRRDRRHLRRELDELTDVDLSGFF